MFKFKRLMVCLISCFTLFLSFNYFSVPTAEAAVSYNTDLAKAWGISDKYMNNFYKKMWYDSQSADPYNELNYKDGDNELDYMQNTFNKQLNAALIMRLGHCYPSDINSKLSIKVNEYNQFYIKESSGNETIDLLILNYVKTLGKAGRITSFNEKYNKNVQPTWKVKGNKIDFYIPCVRYDSDVEKEIETSLEKKLKVLTGKSFDVNFRGSQEKSMQKYFNESTTDVDLVGTLIDGNEIYEHYNLYDSFTYSEYNNCAIFIYKKEFKDFAKLVSKQLDCNKDLGAKGPNQRYDLATLAEVMFMQPFSNHIWFSCEDFYMRMDENGRICIGYNK